jgi:hypothetical protein
LYSVRSRGVVQTYAELVDETYVHVDPQTVTSLDGFRPVPAIVRLCPPANEPSLLVVVEIARAVVTVAVPLAYPIFVTRTATAFTPAGAFAVHVTSIAVDVPVTTQAEPPIVTTFSLLVVLNPVPAIVSVPDPSNVVGVTDVMTGVFAVK